MPTVPTIELSNIPWECTPLVTRPEAVHLTGDTLIIHPADFSEVAMTFNNVIENDAPAGTVITPFGVEIWEDGSYYVFFRVNTRVPDIANAQLSLFVDGFNSGIRTYTYRQPWLPVNQPAIAMNGATLTTFTAGQFLSTSLRLEDANPAPIDPVDVIFRSLHVIKRRSL